MHFCKQNVKTSSFYYDLGGRYINQEFIFDTRASKDGWVDAIAFDSDPIRGGKIVIQTKRYTNTVGVSTVRDLYRTVLKEGASKGILETTADYGPDSYEFANNKVIRKAQSSSMIFSQLSTQAYSMQNLIKLGKL